MRLSRSALKPFAFLVAAALAGISGSVVANDIPGSAQLAPRATHSPEPEPLLNTTMAGANVGLWITPEGTVESAEYIKGTAEWKQAVLEAVKSWKFEPVFANGVPIPARVQVGFTQQRSKDILVDFSPLPNLPGELHSTKEWGLTAPAPANDLSVVLPLGVRGSRAPLVVVLKYVIEADGTTGRFALNGASSEYAVRAALDLVGAFRFEPAKVRGQPVPVEMEQKVSFLWQNDLVPALNGAIEVPEPVFPYERLLGDQEGRAKVRFSLSESGKTKTEIISAACPEHPDFNNSIARAVRGWMDAQTVKLKPGEEHVQEFTWRESQFGKATVKFKLAGDGTVESSELVAASHPDFGAALVAAVESWSFTPEAAAAKAEREYTHFFALDEASYGLRRLAAMAARGEFVSTSGKGLDGRLVQSARATLSYPKKLFATATEGSARVEFVIDRSGLTVMPRVVEATHPEFGWAAATWINSWRFKPMTRGGAPTEIRVTQQVKFTMPAK